MDTRQTLLLVEDEAILAMGTSMLLKQHEYNVLHAMDGDSAVQMAEQQDVDLVLMDIDLGRNRMPGTEAARKILDSRKLPIVFLTNHTEKEVVEKVQGITKYGYVVKNSGEFVLLESIRMAFELYSSHCKLEESEEKYRIAYTISPEAMAITRMHDGVYIDVNAGFERFSGFSREEVIGKPSSEIGLWADDEQQQDFRRRMENDLSVSNMEAVFRNKNGVTGTGLVSARILNLQGEVYILSIVNDITRRKEMEHRLQISERRYRTIVQANSDGYCLADMEGRIIDVNDTYCRMSGYRREELLNLHVEDLEALQSSRDVRNMIVFLKEDGGGSFNTSHRKKGGTVYPVAVSVTHLSLEEQDNFVIFIRPVQVRGLYN